MTQFAIIENGVVVNITEAKADWVPEDGVVAIGYAGHSFSIGDLYVGGVHTALNAAIDHSNHPTSEVNGLATTYTFTPGQAIPSHNHANGGRHITEVVSGGFTILRDGDSSFHGPGDTLSFSATEEHTITCETAGVIVNTTVPTQLSRFQALAALDAAGLLDDVELVMSNEATPKVQKLAWLHANEFERSSPTLEALAQILNLSTLQVDNLFISGATIVA